MSAFHNVPSYSGAYKLRNGLYRLVKQAGEFPIPLRVGKVVAGEAEIRQLWWGERDSRKIAPIF